MTKLDSTRDLMGSFYAIQDWRKLHSELAEALECEFGAKFKDNGNSFNSCFQFEGKFAQGQLLGRIKYYWKSLSLVQSESVSQSIGMNMRALFYPSVRMNLALRESRNEGQSRIEITYTAQTKQAEDEFLDSDFVERAKIDLNRAEDALNRVYGLGWHLPLHELLDDFIAATRKN